MKEPLLDIWKKLKRQEWFIFLSINVLFPYACIPFLMISHDHLFRLISVLTIASVLLLANIYRIQQTKTLRKLYISIAILNVLSFPFAGDMSFATALDMWALNMATIYEITLGDGHARGWPFEIS